MNELEREREMAGFHLEKLPLPPNILRLFILVCSLVPFALLTSWSSNGIAYYHFNTKDYNYIQSFEFYLVVSVVTFIFSIIMFINILLDLQVMPCLLDLSANLILMTFWIVSGSLLAVTLSDLSMTVAVKEARINFNQIEAALGVGFMCAVLLLGNVWFALAGHRKEQEIEPSLTGRSPLVTDIPIDILS